MRQTIIAVAPTGARKTQKDHPNLPMSQDDILWAAETCLEAGGSLFHLHVRNPEGKHTIEPRYYAPVLEALNKRFADDLVVQVSTEACGIFTAKDQMNCVNELQPEAVSLGLKEIIPAVKEAKEEAAEFFTNLEKTHTHYQFIIYRPGDLIYLTELMDQGFVPNRRHAVLFVLGSYFQQNEVDAYDLVSYLAANKKGHSWMACAFGAAEFTVAQAAIALGGDVRVGFENNLYLPSGKQAWSNKELVEIARQSVLNTSRQYADAKEVRKQFAALKEA